MRLVYNCGILLIFFLSTIVIFNVEGAFKNLDAHHVIDSRYNELLELSEDSPVIKMSLSTLKEYLRPPDRNYTIIVSYRLVGYKIPPILLETFDHFSTIAYSYKKGSYDKAIFFIAVYDNRELQRLCNENDMHLLPLIIHYPPNSPQTSKDIFDMRWTSPTIHNIVQFIKQRTKVDIALKTKLNPSSLIMMVITLLFISMIFYYFYDIIMKFNKRKVWAIISIVFITLMQSGYMLNHINGTQFFGNEIFKGETRQQYGIESFILFFLYLAVVISLIMVNNINSASKKDDIKGFSIQKFFKIGFELFSVLLFCGSIFILFKIVKLKLSWYPLFF